MGVHTVAVDAEGALHGLGAVASPPSLVQVDGGEALPAGGILGDRMGNGLGVDEEGLPVEVVNSVADLVIVDVVRDTSLTAEELLLGLGLGDLSTGEETAGGDAVLDEAGVVGAARELGGDRGGALGLVEVLKVLLDDVGSGGAGEVVGGSITIVDAEDVVGGGDHVEVEVGTDLGQLGLRAVDRLDVEVGAEETEFLSAEEGKADGVLDAEVAEVLGNVQNTNGTGTVIVNTGAGRDGIGVTTNDKDVVVITTLGLGDDVVVDTLLNGGIDVEGSLDGASRESLEDGGGVLLADTHNRGVVLEGGAEGASKRASNVVVDDDASGTGSLGAQRLLSEGASATGHKGDLAGNLGGVVGGSAAKVGNGNEVGGNLTAGGVGHDGGGDIGTANSEGGGTLGEDLGEGLLHDIVVVEALEGVVDVVNSGVVTAATESAVTTVSLGK